MREIGYEEDIKRREGWKMNANRKSDTPLGISLLSPLELLKEKLKCERGMKR